MYSLVSLINSVTALTRTIPSIKDIPLFAVLLFIRLGIDIRNDIVLVQERTYDPSTPPRHLSPSIVQFLASACALLPKEVIPLWETLRVMIWESEEDPLLLSIRDSESYEQLFRNHGYLLGFTSSRNLWPPVQHCTNPECRQYQQGFKLHTATQKHALLLSLAHGPIPVWAVHFRCNGCNTTYHHNMALSPSGQYISAAMGRTYYDTISENIQIGEHCFAERRILDQWRSSINLAWVSASNCITIYLQMFPDAHVPESWNISLSLSHRTAWEGFIIYSLWLDAVRREQALQFPHDHTRRDCLNEAMKARNQHIKLFGQPEKRHRCDKCVRIYHPDDPTQPVRTVSVVVCDGTSIGRPRCYVETCKETLQSPKDRYCLIHTHYDDFCYVPDCTEPRTTKFTCNLPNYLQAGKEYEERGQSVFQLKRRLEAAQRAALDNSQLITVPVLLDEADEADDAADGDSDDEDEDEDEDDGDPTTILKKPKKAFQRRRTHNEQLLIYPCGMVAARVTFYHSESLPSVASFVKETYWDGALPDHLVFDNNCGLSKHVKDNPTFPRIGLAVDVFHFKSKHKASDTYCQENCNPAAFPELLRENGKGWWFNTSICEQVNA
ncbi:hypothetical protein BDZ89DRAFT_1145472 [Hymenopellis radicata]|nr:hypothetical protein BDZ89DRAFT_1145472 [Hymenopellis radicata]